MKHENNYVLGRLGEDKVAGYYTQRGYRLVARNFQYYSKGTQGRLGEIDLVLQGRNTLCFVEVKSRSDLRFGRPAEQINTKKLRHLFKTYQYFMLKHPQYRQLHARFDVAEVLQGEINIIPNAYNFDDFWR